jgi:uncharacterized protein (TIGR03382 family)
MVGQNNGGHDFWSNQFLGGAPAGTGNLGGPGNKDFTLIDGDQFFNVVVPEPATGALAAMALGLAALAARRRGA